jgi:hypothetical protein
MNEPMPLSLTVDVAIACIIAENAENAENIDIDVAVACAENADDIPAVLAGTGDAWCPVGIGHLLLCMGCAAPTTAWGLLELIEALIADPRVQQVPDGDSLSFAWIGQAEPRRPRWDGLDSGPPF